MNLQLSDIILLIKGVAILISTSLILTFSWKGRSKWEPSEEDIPKGPQKLTGLISTVSISLIWSFWSFLDEIDVLLKIVILCTILCVFFFFLYSYLIGVLVFKNKLKEINIIGGIYLRSEIKQQLKNSNQNITLSEIYEHTGFNEDKIWTRSSRALSKVIFFICYMALTSFGSIALCSATVIYLLKSNKEVVKHQTQKILIGFAVILNGDVHYTREILEGFREELVKLLEPTIYKPHFEIAIGYPSKIDSIKNSQVVDGLLSEFDDKPEYIITIGTNISEYVYNNYKNYPIVFIGVSDPNRSGLIPLHSNTVNRANISGVKYGLPMKKYLDFYEIVFPCKTIGYVYNPIYPQDLYLKEEIMEEMQLKKRSLKVVPIQVATDTLSKEQERGADIFWGRFAVSTEYKKFLKKTDKPFIGNSPLMVNRGAILSMSIDDSYLGQLAAQKIIIPNLLQGVSLKKIPLQIVNKPIIAVNLKTARKFDITIGKVILDSASLIVN